MKLNCITKKISDSCYQVDNDLAIYYYFDDKCSVLHKIDGPAIQFKTGEVHYFVQGMRHNIAGPAVSFNEFHQYWINDVQYSLEDFNAKILKLQKKIKDVQSQS